MQDINNKLKELVDLLTEINASYTQMIELLAEIAQNTKK